MIEHRVPSNNFYLERMEVIYEAAQGKADVPHRHDYYTVLFVGEAKGNHIIDYKTYSFQGLEVFFVAPGQVHQVALTERPAGWAFTFSKDFLAANNIPESFISNINLFKAFGETPSLKLDQETYNMLHRVIEDMEHCLPRELTYRDRALGALLQLFLIYCNNSKQFNQEQIDEENAGVCILRDFKQLIEEKYSSWHKVNDYASEIHITPKHLSQTIKNITGKSAKEFIQDRLLLEAKRLLLHTDMSVKEVGYALGFEEPLHFSGFFKKRGKISPSKFRKDKQ